MAKSKTDPKRKHKKESFKTKAKQMSEQQAQPKGQVIPDLSWDSKANILVRGDLLEAMNRSFTVMNQYFVEIGKHFQIISQVYQQIFALNIKEGIVKMDYKWQNGVPLTEQEKATYEAQMEEFRKLRQQEFEKAQQQAQEAEEEAKKLENAAKTGLVGLDGAPIGTTQNLDGDDEEDDDAAGDESDYVSESDEINE